MPTAASAICSLPCWPLIGASTLFHTCPKFPQSSDPASLWPSMKMLRPLLLVIHMLSRPQIVVAVLISWGGLEYSCTGKKLTSSTLHAELYTQCSSYRVYWVLHLVSVDALEHLSHLYTGQPVHVPISYVAYQAPFTHLPCRSPSHTPVVPIQSSVDPSPLSKTAYSRVHTLLSAKQACSGALRMRHT